MWPLPTGLILKLCGFALAICGAFVYGLTVGKHWDDAKIANAAIDTQKKKQSDSQELAKTIRDTQDTYDKANSTLLAANALLLNSLSNRPSSGFIVRVATPVAGQCATVAATGADLSQDDARFPVWLASEAGRLSNALTACYQRENALRGSMAKP